MKTLFFLSILCLFGFSGCQKSDTSEPSNLPSGKWKSIAFKNVTSWQPEVMPHYFEIKEDNTYSFRDHNGALCTGRVFPAAINNINRIHFQDSDCGLTDRSVESLSKDTLELSVVVPPNITHDWVKYVREN